MSQDLIGIGSIVQLESVLNQYCFQSLFLVTGEKSFMQSSLQVVLQPLLSRYPHIRFCGFQRNPQLDDLYAGLQIFQALTNPLVIAIGGGSVLDMAKLIRFFAECNLNPKLTPESYFLQGIRPEKQAAECAIPLVAIPTTSGTGSEATQFATIYIERTKYSLDDPRVRPNITILDPELTLCLPARETAESGLDALSQAIESYWNVHATDESKSYARAAMCLIHQHLESAVLSPTLGDRAAMQKGANLAGKAINLTRTTAPHAISYPMTSHFDVPHGQAVSLSLPYFLEYNYGVSEADVWDTRGAAYVRDTLDEIVESLGYPSVQAAKEGLIQLMRRIGVKTSLRDLGIDRAGWDIIVANGFNPQRVRNNPRQLTEGQLRELLAAFGE